MAQWTLTDVSTGTPQVLTFEWNPTTFEHPGRAASIQQDVTSAPNGQPILFQGRDKTRTMRFAGAVGTKTFYDDLDLWKDKWYPMVLSDDEGNEWTIIIVDWKWTRVKRRNPWRFDYTAEALVL